MRMRISRWLGATVVVAVLLGLMLAIPAWAAPSRQDDGPALAPYDAMHEACEAGDVQGMTDAMNSLTEEDRQAMGEHMASDHHEAMGTGMTGEDRQAMEEHMGDGHHGAIGTGMMGMGGMMGGWAEASGGWSGMMSW